MLLYFIFFLVSVADCFFLVYVALFHLFLVLVADRFLLFYSNLLILHIYSTSRLLRKKNCSRVVYVTFQPVTNICEKLFVQDYIIIMKKQSKVKQYCNKNNAVQQMYDML